MNRRYHAVGAVLIAIGALASAGCQDDAYCFEGCAGNGASVVDSGISNNDSGTDWDGAIQVDGGQDGAIVVPDGSSDTQCTPDNVTELCDGRDNDCNGQVDEGYDLHDPRHCGSCENNCFTVLVNAESSTITCDWSGVEGEPGKCKFTACAQDWYDLDGPENGCEYACVPSNTDETQCDNRDNDCDGAIDEDVDYCASVKDCGYCGNRCVILHGTAGCEHTGNGACDATNTRCVIASCNDDDGDGSPDHWDLDNSAANGCEYACSLTNGGVEICGDGIDNDCDGLIDGADDDLTGDPSLGQPCFGDPDGECAQPEHQGTTACQGQQVVCTGPDVIFQGQQPETCNGKDDDCDGVVDNKLTDVGAACGTSSIFPCAMGTQQCVNGALKCVGAIEPSQELCNGMDDDCDGTIDDSPVDAVGSCGQSDEGACQLGTKVCVGGVVQCNGNVDAKPEVCNGIDDDCDGVIDNNPTDVGGTCGQSGVAPCKLGTYQCVGGVVECVGAIDPTAEQCDGIDNDCDGTIDDGVPGAGASCGLSDTFPCRRGSMQCVAGAMVCVGNIDPRPETCNGVDDDCNGAIDDATTDSGGSCGQTDVGPCKFGTLQCQNGALVCTGNVDPQPERCNGFDDDCDGTVDNNVTGVGVQCGQTDVGPCKFGTVQCEAGAFRCVGAIEPQTETCNGIDDDCDGVVDDNAAGTGEPCGVSNTAPCSFGARQCQNGVLMCVGAVDPQPETCNGVDDDCDGVIDQAGGSPPPDSVGSCNVPPPPPAGATSPCQAGTKACVGGVVQCQNYVGPPSSSDGCGVDSNCDGNLTNQPDLQSDVRNCGACGNDCMAGAVHAIWSCVAGTCQFQGCQPGYYDLDGDKKCEYACVFVQSQEACNGVDDNCNGQVDENVLTPSPVQVCGVSPSASRPECTSQVSVKCEGGSFVCQFPANVCNPTCTAAAEVCDTLDNDCDGVLNENVSNYGQTCASDDGIPYPGHGACRTVGTYACNGPNSTACTAQKADCATLPGGCTELCDGIDNDCDALVDETFNNKGSSTAYFVKPAVTKVASSLWIYSFESSRPNATSMSPGSGNGYHSSAPAGTPLEKTLSCSVSNRIPWFNVTGIEVDQTCRAVGGRACTPSDWQTACRASASCRWGYAPRGSACTSSYTTSKFCNLGPSFDFDSSAAGDQDGLLPTGSGALSNCYADWSGLQGNGSTDNKVFDITGNLREITMLGTEYTLLGGAFETQTEAGAECSFTFYKVDGNFKFFDTGFRCCFDQDPRL